MSYGSCNLTADEALERLREGNARYLNANQAQGDVSPELRQSMFREGQHPYAIVLACSDSRVIPEAIFSAGIGELFVIRVAGNVVDRHQLGSIEYAEGHLGCNLVVVLGHAGCGAVDAAMHHEPYGTVKFITDEIADAIGNETDEATACLANVAHSVRRIEESQSPNRRSRTRPAGDRRPLPNRYRGSPVFGVMDGGAGIGGSFHYV